MNDSMPYRGDLRLYQHQGYWWLGYETNGKLYLICRKGKVGDCIQA